MQSIQGAAEENRIATGTFMRLRKKQPVKDEGKLAKATRKT